MYHAFYSHQQAKLFGFAVFQKEDGSFVVASETTYEEKPSGKYNDWIDQGMVIKLVQNYDANEKPIPPLTLKDIDPDYIELSDDDIISSKPSVKLNALSPNAKAQWAEQAKKVSSFPFNPIFRASIVGYKKQQYQVN